MTIKLPPNAGYALRHAPVEQQKKILTILNKWPSHVGQTHAAYLKARSNAVTLLVRAWNGVWLNPQDKTGSLKLQCDQGHIWSGFSASSQIGQLRKGHWCPTCNLDRRGASLKSMQELARQNQGKCLSTEYKQSSAKLKWQCKEGHIWESSREVIMRGHWCPQCKVQNHQKLQLDEVKKLARQRGGECLSKHYMNDRIKLSFRCGKNHVWQTSASVIRSGRWCQSCHIDKLRLSIDSLHQLAAKHGGLCLATKHTSTNDLVKWQCHKGHTWQAPAKYLFYDGKWCPQCSHEKRALTIPKLQEIARSRGGKCLSHQYKGSTTKLLWKCKLGHTWLAAPVSVKRGTWCPECAIIGRCKYEKAKRKYLPDRRKILDAK